MKSYLLTKCKNFRSLTNNYYCYNFENDFKAINHQLPRPAIQNQADMKPVLDGKGYQMVMFGKQSAYLDRWILYLAVNHLHKFLPIRENRYFCRQKLISNLVRIRNDSKLY